MVRWRSPHFEYATAPDDDQTCPDILALLEENRSFWRQTLGLAGAGEQRIRYRKFRTLADLARSRMCPPGSGGCAQGTTVRSADPFDAHELIHVYMAEVSPPPAPLFTEGAAVGLSCVADTGIPDALPDWRSLISVEPGQPEYDVVYALGGNLVAHLVKTQGAEAFGHFYRAVANDRTADAIAARFAAGFGISLDDAWQAAGLAGRCASLWSCSRVPVTVDGAENAALATCGVAHGWRTLDVAGEGQTDLSVASPPGTFGGAAIGRCDDPTDGSLAGLPAGRVVSAHLPPGRYRLSLPAAASIAVTRPATSFVGAACDPLIARPLTAASGPLSHLATVIAPTRAAPIFARLRADQPIAVRLSVLDQATGLSLCPTCAIDEKTCPSATRDRPAETTIDGDVVWQMRPWFFGDDAWMQATLWSR